MDMYAGEHGFLGRHRMKVYGYLELAFKVGRSVTIGGFSGAFKDRTWDEVDGELEAARFERRTHGAIGVSAGRGRERQSRRRSKARQALAAWSSTSRAAVPASV